MTTTTELQALNETLTPDQRASNQRWIDNFILTQKSHQERNLRVIGTLAKAGFIKDQDFIYEDSWEDKVQTYSIGSQYNGTYKKMQVTLREYTGYCKIIYYRYYSHQKKLIKDSQGISYDRGKLNSYILQENFRYVKPETLLKKLHEYNENSKREMKKDQEEKTVINYTLDKYKTRYPNALVTHEIEGSHYGYGNRRKWSEHDVVKILFTSGSWVKLRLGSQLDNEYVSSKQDAIVNKLSKDDLLTYFNNQ